MQKMKYFLNKKEFKGLKEGSMYCSKCGEYMSPMEETDTCIFCRTKERDKEQDLLYCKCGEYIGGLSGEYCNKCRKEMNEE